MADYWASRIETQLRYLREINAVNQNCLDELLDGLTARLAEMIEAEGAVTKQAALALEQAMAPASALCKAVTVSCVAHAHIDMNWMWRFDETAAITVDTFRTMLQLMREYPEFTFAQSQASVYKIVEDYAPELLPEIRRRIAEGRWEVTASHWVETDKNMPNGESLTRHLLYTRKYLKDLLGLTDDQFEIDYEPDTFGHGANVPEILASGGVRYMYHCRGYDGHCLYRWQAPSGARVTVYREPTWYNETISDDSFLYVPGFCAKHGLEKLIHVYGVGDHGGGATRRDIERILDYNTWPCMPEIKFGRYIDFFRYIDTLELPVVDHELNFIFDGCYTSQSRIKRANRVAEAALYESEFFNTMSQLCGAYPYDAKAYEKLWRNVLFNHFHDILPGSGTIDTREYALGLFQQTMAGAGTRGSAAMRALAAQVNTAALLPVTAPPQDSIAEGAGVGFGVEEGFRYSASAPVGGKRRLFVLFNPNQAALETATVLTVWDWDGDMHKLRITDENGQTLEHELLDSKPQGYWGHKYFRAQIVCKLPPFGWRTVLLEESAAFTPTVPHMGPRVDEAAEYVLENEHVKAVFDPRSAALVSFLDKATGKEHIGGKGMLRYIEEDTTRGMSAWRVGRHGSDAPVTAAKMTGVTGGLVRSFKFEAQVKHSSLEVTVSLDKNARHVKYSVRCDWREFGMDGECIPQLAYRLPLASACEAYSYDNACGVIERGPLDHDVPGQSFACADGLMLSSDSKYGFRCFDNAMAVTLIRSSNDPDPAPEIYTHNFTINVGIVDGGLVEASQQQNRNAIAVACGSQEGELPLAGSFVKLTGKAVVSSVKMAEDGEGVIARLYSLSNEDEDVALEFLKPIKSMAYADAHENALGPVIDGKVLCKAKGVTAVKIKF
ncbi:MAG: glycosyl hydrolase-related protein [Firmicutes bacterium]|nr:glycosyl hydrolase-related protein [Bacillota bacterium]